jgi:hypothetical protein
MPDLINPLDLDLKAVLFEFLDVEDFEPEQ